MEFDREKCAMQIMKRVKRETTEGIERENFFKPSSVAEISSKG